MLSPFMGVFSFLPRDLPPRAVSASVQIYRALSFDILHCLHILYRRLILSLRI